MELTRIGAENEEYFAPLLPETASLRSAELLRLGVIEEGTACAAAAFAVSAASAELVSICVSPEYRRRGAARFLLESFAVLAERAGLTSLTACFVREPENGLEPFFKAAGFLLFDSAPIRSLRLADALASESFRKNTADVRGQTFSCEELTPVQRRALAKLLPRYGAPAGELLAGSFSPRLSFVCYEGGEPAAGLFCADFGTQLNLDFLFSASASAAPTMALLARLAAALADRDPALEITFLGANPRVLPIAERLFGPVLRTCPESVYAVRLVPEDRPRSENN